jgi:hypothetical protein
VLNGQLTITFPDPATGAQQSMQVPLRLVRAYQ